MKTLFYLLGLLGLSGVSFILLGFCLPNEFTGEVTKQFTCSKSKVWELLTDPNNQEKIKPEVASVTAHANGWEEVDKLGSVTRFEILEAVENEKLVLKVINPTLNVEKVRTYQVYGNDNSSVVTCTQRCLVDKILLKTTMAISGTNQDIKKELSQLSQQLNS